MMGIRIVKNITSFQAFVTSFPVVLPTHVDPIPEFIIKNNRLFEPGTPAIA
jgi:hypothetical protein